MFDLLCSNQKIFLETKNDTSKTLHKEVSAGLFRAATFLVLLPLQSKQWILIRVRLNYATTHTHPQPPTTTHHQPKYIHQHPSPPAKIYPSHPSPSPPTTSHNTSTNTHHHPKNGLPPSKSQNTLIYCSFSHCFNIFFFFKTQYFRDGDFVW